MLVVVLVSWDLSENTNLQNITRCMIQIRIQHNRSQRSVHQTTRGRKATEQTQLIKGACVRRKPSSHIHFTSQPKDTMRHFESRKQKSAKPAPYVAPTLHVATLMKTQLCLLILVATKTVHSESNSHAQFRCICKPKSQPGSVVQT